MPPLDPFEMPNVPEGMEMFGEALRLTSESQASGMARDALAFLDAAERLSQVLPIPHELRKPIYSLYGQSIELALKAVLTSYGIPQNTHNHDLLGLHGRLVDVIPFEASFLNVLTQLSAYYLAANFRYDKNMFFVVYPPLETAAMLRPQIEMIRDITDAIHVHALRAKPEQKSADDWPPSAEKG